MIKVFTTNKDGKIELTKEELQALLDEAYWDGYKANCTRWGIDASKVALNTDIFIPTDHTDPDYGVGVNA